MRTVLSLLGEDHEMTFDQMFELFELISSNKRDEALSKLITMMGHHREITKVYNRLKTLDITAAKTLLLNKD